MSAPSPRIFFVNRFYWPDEPATAQLLSDLAVALAAAGHQVTVIASHPGTPVVPGREQRHGVTILRVMGTRLGRRSLIRRCVDFASFLRGARKLVRLETRPGDILVALTDPPLLGAFLAATARRNRLRLIHWVQDIFPEVASAVGALPFASLLRPPRDRAWRAADACVTLGDDMASLLVERGVARDRIHVSGNWAPDGLQPPSPTDTFAANALRRAWNLDDKFVLAYSGNLGRVHDLTPIVDLADALRSDPKIAVLVIGDGAQRRSLERMVAKRRLTNIAFRPAQPRESLVASLAVGDLHLVTLRTGCERLVFPSKLYGIAAIGRPVLFIGPPQSEIARLVESRGFGRSFERAAIADMATFVRSLAVSPENRTPLAEAALHFADTDARLPRAVAFWDNLLRGMPLAAPAALSPQ